MNAEAGIQIEIDEAKGSFLVGAEADLPAALASEEKMLALVALVETQARAFVPDLSTVASRKAIASNAYKVARSKVAIEKAAKDLTADMKAAIATVNDVRNVGMEKLQALQDDVRKPLTEWEAAEELRQADLQRRLDELQMPNVFGLDAAALRAEVERIEAIEIDATWAEVEAAARVVHEQTLSTLRAALTVTSEREAERAELEEFRRQKAETLAAAKKAAEENAAAEAAAERDRRRQEREAREAKERQEAADRAAAAAREQIAREAQEKVETERRRTAEAEESARLADERARIAAEQAERDRIAAEERRVTEAKAAEERRAAEVAAARVAERLRIAEEQRQQELERERRAADVRRRAKAKLAIVEVIDSLLEGLDLTRAEIAEIVADALMQGRVPGVEVVL